MPSTSEFESCFARATGHSPFPWQVRLFDEFVEGKFPDSCDIPTGLGKTSVIAIWLLALAERARRQTTLGFPRRLVYVVNRRTVVDQASLETKRLREALATPELGEVNKTLQALCGGISDPAVAISTLRGEFADNAEWRTDPSRPAVIVGTVDMIGSRLLFAGYGCGFKSRPLHAAFVGQDSLLVHDEAHLEPAFQCLLEAVVREQQRCAEFRPMRVMALTATSRSGGEPFRLSDADRNHKEVRKRFEARKRVRFVSVDDAKNLPDVVLEQALAHRDSGAAILVFLRRLEHVDKVAQGLRKVTKAVETLTGTLRGLERDALATRNAVFARFLRDATAAAEPGTVFLVCTSAGEVGVNISADHLVCDLVPMDSLAQRFGRVNRFGNGDADVRVVVSPLEKSTDKPDSKFTQACERTRSLLLTLPIVDGEGRNASPSALSALLNHLSPEERDAVYTPCPEVRAATDILFDRWSLTSIRSDFPGRPPVGEWLHGREAWEPPDTYVAWRDEVERLTGDVLDMFKVDGLDDLLDDYPLKPHEILRDQTARVFAQLELVAARNAAWPIWLVPSEGDTRTMSVAKLVERDRQNKPLIDLADCIVLLPPAAGALHGGLLSGNIPRLAAERYDVSNEWLDEAGQPRRQRVWDVATRPRGMRLVRAIDIPTNDEEEEDDLPPRSWFWYVVTTQPDADGSRSAHAPQELEPHLRLAEDFATAVATRLHLHEPELSAVVVAAGCHDLGKRREIWQHSIGNWRYPATVLAKSGGRTVPADASSYRHELGSLADVSTVSAFAVLDADARDIALHLIAAHHGRARPHFPENEAFDLEREAANTAALVRDASNRFARLQRKYGRWGLAYLESLVRAADILASQPGQ